MQIDGPVFTSHEGVQKLMDFYKEASAFSDQQITVNLYNLGWVDANLTALLDAIGHRLSQENNLRFSTDFGFVAEKFPLFLEIAG